MKVKDELVQLIVCSNRRSIELAKVLQEAGPVYQSSLEDANVWSYSLFENNDWQPVLSASSVPKEFSLLFFHTGESDPSGIPNDRTFVKEFAFSTGGVSHAQATACRKKAIPIQRHFPTGGCPVKKRHIDELREFVNGTRSELPAFCRHEETIPALGVLVVLTQCYAAAGIASGEIKTNDSFAIDLGWNRLDPDAISGLSRRLADLWPEMQRIEWWRTSLGISDDAGETVSAAKSQTFLARLIEDLELDVMAGTKLNLPVGADLSEQAAANLLDFLKTQPKAFKIVEFLAASRADRQTIENAYKEMKDFLEQR